LAVEAGADGGEFGEAAFVAGFFDEGGCLGIVVFSLGAEIGGGGFGGVVFGGGAEIGITSGGELGEEETGGFQVAIGEVERHFAVACDVEGLGEVGFGVGENALRMAKGGAGEVPPGQVVLNKETPSIAQ
jgi:hypothetical protein